MKNRFLSLTLIMFLTATSVAALQCPCVLAYCRLPAVGSLMHGSGCHQESAVPSVGWQALPRCCGRCAAQDPTVLTERFSVPSFKGSKVMPLDPLLSQAPSKGLHPHRHKGLDGVESYRYFLTEQLLNFTFAFRAPPLA